MRVGIIGTGNMGSAFAKMLSRTRHEVFVGSRDPEKAKKIATCYTEKGWRRSLCPIGQDVKYGSIKEAVKFGEIIILAVPWPSAKQALSQAGDLKNKIVLDITNPLTNDFSGLDVGFTTSAAEEIAKMVPEAKVVKAFNTIFAHILSSSIHLKSPRPNVFICGDDEDVKKKISQLAKDLGFEPLDLGPLNRARFMETLGMLTILLGYDRKLGTKIAFRVIKARKHTTIWEFYVKRVLLRGYSFVRTVVDLAVVRLPSKIPKLGTERTTPKGS